MGDRTSVSGSHAAARPRTRRRGLRLAALGLAAFGVAAFGIATAVGAQPDATAPGARPAPLDYAPGVTAANAASEASIRQLLAVTETRALLDRSAEQMEGVVGDAVAAALKDRPLQPPQRKILDDAMRQIVAVLRDELRWDRLEPMFLEIYRRTFTQAEVDGLLEFYATPAGQALVRKMPVVQDYSMQLMQAQMQSAMPRLQEIQRKLMTDLARSVEQP